MNNTRRNQINRIITRLETIQTEVEEILSDEQEYNENIPENMLDGQNAENSNYAIDYLEQIDVEDVLESLREASA
jgi:hypothetical protein